jgi:hypothetical protein
MDGERQNMHMTQDGGSIAAENDAHTTAERLAQSLEDAVERSMSDFESEHAARKSLRPGVNDELTPESLDPGR